MTTQPSSVQLGALLHEHPPRVDLGRSHLALAAVSVIGMVGAAGVGVVRWYLAFSHFGPALVWRWSSPAFLIAAGLGIAGMVAILTAWRLRGVSVRVHQNGLMVLRGRRGTWIPWNRILSVQTSLIRYGPPGFARRREAGLVLRYHKPGSGNPAPKPGWRSIRLTHALDGIENLGAAVKERVYPLLLEASSESFNRGIPLVFGKLHLTTQGLQVRKRLLPWTALGEISLARGELVIRPAAARGGPTFRIAAHRVPNVELCVQLIQYLSQQA